MASAVCRRSLRRLPMAGWLCALGACVVWPAGTGPGAEPMPFAEAVARRERGEAVFLDLRTPAEYSASHLGGAVNVPLPELPARLGEIRRLGRLPILYCG